MTMSGLIHSAGSFGASALKASGYPLDAPGAAEANRTVRQLQGLIERAGMTKLNYAPRFGSPKVAFQTENFTVATADGSFAENPHGSIVALIPKNRDANSETPKVFYVGSSTQLQRALQSIEQSSECRLVSSSSKHRAPLFSSIKRNPAAVLA
jgi:hypothetical protein